MLIVLGIPVIIGIIYYYLTQKKCFNNYKIGFILLLIGLFSVGFLYPLSRGGTLVQCTVFGLLGIALAIFIWPSSEVFQAEEERRARVRQERFKMFRRIIKKKPKPDADKEKVASSTKAEVPDDSK